MECFTPLPAAVQRIGNLPVDLLLPLLLLLLLRCFMIHFPPYLPQCSAS